MRVLVPSGLCYVFGQVGKREHFWLHLMSAATREFGFHDLLVWDRVVDYNTRRDSFDPAFEQILVLKKEGDVARFDKDAVRKAYDEATKERYLKDNRYADLEKRRAHLDAGKWATNIWRVPSLKGSSREKVGHPTQKPLQLLERLCCLRLSWVIWCLIHFVGRVHRLWRRRGTDGILWELRWKGVGLRWRRSEWTKIRNFDRRRHYFWHLRCYKVLFCFMASSRSISTSQKLRYRFDQSMAAGPIALIGWLALVSLVLIAFAGLILYLTGIGPEEGKRMSFIEAMWSSLMRTLDAGTMGGDAGWAFRGIMFLVTIAGIFIVSALIGVLTSGLESKMDELRKGRSFVIEENHTLILGWSASVFTIISELVVANENQKAPRIVILADRDKVEMEEELRSKVGSTKNTRVICRTGSPIDLYDLEIANPHQAKSIIILSPDEAGADADSQVIKTILALTNNPRRRPSPYHIVAEIRDAKNMEAAYLVGRDEAKIVQSNELIARITVQTCRQSGMSVIYTELLDYGGDEIYFKAEPGLSGKTFGDALFSYEASTVFGLHTRDGKVLVNPPMNTPIQDGDEIIAISADDDTVQLSGISSFDVDESLIRNVIPAPPVPERTLILGWNARGCLIVNELDSYVAPGSEVVVMADLPEVELQIARLCGNLKNLNAHFQIGDTTDRATLDALQIAGFEHVIVLGYSEMMGPQQADARTLITLLHLRQIEQNSGKSLAIVSEMQDVRNRELAEVTQADDFIVSDNLVSLLLTQVSENKHLHAVFADLFDSNGSEIYLKPASDYVSPGVPLNFYTVVEAARRRNEIAIGYRIAANSGNSQKQYGVVVNPNKAEQIQFAPQDLVIVISES